MEIVVFILLKKKKKKESKKYLGTDFIGDFTSDFIGGIIVWTGFILPQRET